MSDAVEPRVEVGDLLVATPSLLDPNFEYAVVLMLDVDDGALGIVLNRPSVVPVEEVIETGTPNITAGWLRASPARA